MDRDELTALPADELLDRGLAHPLARVIYAHDRERRKQGALFASNDLLTELVTRDQAAALVHEALTAYDPIRVPLSSSTDTQVDLLLRLDLLSLIALHTAVAGRRAVTARFRDAIHETYEAASSNPDHFHLDVLARLARIAIADGRQLDLDATILPTTLASDLSGTPLQQLRGLATFTDAVGWAPVDGALATTATVTRPNGTSVTVVERAEASPEVIQANNAWVEAQFPNATRLTTSSRRYNCHSYAWHQSNPSNPYWLSAPEHEKYWTDGSWAISANFWQAGSRMDWRSDDHSGVVVAGQKLWSKWGELPVMEHALEYTPYDNSNVAGWYVLA